MARHEMDAAAKEIQAALQEDPTWRELVKSQKLLAKAALVKARGYDAEDAEDDDEWDAQQENDEDAEDEDEDEDQNADDPDADSGVDDERGTVGRTKKSRIKKSKGEAAEDELVRAKLRLKKAERALAAAKAEDDEDGLKAARKSRKRAEQELNRARGKLHRAKPAWVGDEDEEEEDSRRRRKTAQEWYADSEDSYFTNEDADHQEDGSYPPDGPEVADGDDTDQYSIGAHKVHSQRAMRRSYRGAPSKQALHKSMAADGRITEDLLDAAPALELIAEVLGDQQGLLAKSTRTLGRHDEVLGLMARNMIAQGKTIQQLAKSVALMERQVPNAPMSGMFPQFGVVAGGQSKKGSKLQKSKADLLLDAEDALNRGMIDANTFTAMGRAASADEAASMVPAAVQTQLGWK